MVHFSQLVSAAALVSVSSAVPMVRRYAPSATMNTYSSYQTGSYQSSSGMDSSYGSSYDSSYGSADSSYGSMDSSYGSMDSSYGSSDSSYGSSDSSYGNNWNSMSTETMMEAMTSTSSSYAMQTSSVMYTQTSSAMSSQATYGSGSASWSGSSSSGYNSCVQQCSAQFGGPPPSATTPPSEEVSGTSTGSGATHTIIVAPSAGVLRYMPFATNASVGDTVVFQWDAGTHTVTQSSALEVCNKTANGFASGQRSAGAVFNQVINDTQPIWFYCGIPGHCEAGMFGGINVGNPQPAGELTSNSTYMPMSSVLSDMSQDSDISSAWNYTVSVVGSNSSLSGWGMDINCAGMNDDTKKQALLNVLYSQAVMAMNPNSFQNGKVVNASAPLKLPQQFAVQANATQTNATQTNSSSSPTTSAPANGVESLLAPRYMVALVAVVASFTLI